MILEDHLLRIHIDEHNLITGMCSYRDNFFFFFFFFSKLQSRDDYSYLCNFLPLVFLDYTLISFRIDKIQKWK